MDSDLSGRQHYPPFEKLGPDVLAPSADPILYQDLADLNFFFNDL